MSQEKETILSATDVFNETDEVQDIRPPKLDSFIGQAKTKENLKVFVQAAKKRGQPLDHVILSGPPGLGKTTLARIIANEMGSPMHTAMAPNLTKRGDLAQILTVLKAGDILFIDEIHRLSTAVEEVLYSAMEDLAIDLMLGEGLGAKSVRIPLSPFTLVGATTRLGDLSAPLTDRFGIPLLLDFYEVDDLVLLVNRSAGIFGIQLEDAATLELAKRCRRTPRIANRLLKRLRDYATAGGLEQEVLKVDFVQDVLEKLEVDSLGLTKQDRQLLTAIIEKYQGGPVGLKVLAVLLSEGERTVEDAIEPYLVRTGLIVRTPRGRVAAKSAYDHLGIPMPGNTGDDASQMTIDDMLGS